MSDRRHLQSIRVADLQDRDVADLLDYHVRAGAAQCATHVFDAQRLKESNTLLFEGRDAGGALLGIAGIKRLNRHDAEIKSVRTHPHHLRKGVSRALMEHITGHAVELGLSRLFLETHPTAAYAPARELYERLGYTYCGPFGDYADTGESVFMVRDISGLRVKAHEP